MQEFDKQRYEKGILKDLSVDERQRLVGAFLWLIQEDKRQNPAFYKNNND